MACKVCSRHLRFMLLFAAPEVISAKTSYNGQKADIWSCGVMLYVMLFCEYPFERPEDEADRWATMPEVALQSLGLPAPALMPRAGCACMQQAACIQAIAKMKPCSCY